MDSRRFFIVAVAVWLLTITSLGLWDLAENHPAPQSYCFPWCLGGPQPSYVAADTLVAVIFASAGVIVFLSLKRRRR